MAKSRLKKSIENNNQEKIMLQSDDAKTLKQLALAISLMVAFTVTLIITVNVLF